MQHFCPTLAFKPLIPLVPTWFLPLLPHHRLLLLTISLHLLLPLFLTTSRFSNGMLGVSEPGALNYFTFFRLISMTLFVSSNLTLTHLPLFPSLDSLLCDLITPTPDPAFFLLMPRTLAAASSSFSSGRAYPSLRFLPSFFSSLDPYSDYVGVVISLNNPSLLSILNVYALPICSSSTDGRTESSSPSILPFSRNLFILENFNCRHPFWDSSVTSDSHGEEIFDWVIASDIFLLHDPDIPFLLHCSSPDIFFAPSFLALSCSWQMFQHLGSDHLPILLSVPRSPVYRPN